MRTPRTTAVLLFILVWMGVYGLAQRQSAASAHAVDLPLVLRANGTLVVIVGTAKGLVVAADSRSTIPWRPGTFCDDAFKILIPERPNRTVVMVTGNGTWVDFKPDGTTDICSAIRSSPQLLDIGSLAKIYLEKKNTKLSKLPLAELGDICVNALKAFQTSFPSVLEGFIGHEIFSVVMADYNPKTQIALIKHFVIRIDADSKELQAANFTDDAIAQRDRWVVIPFGESDYFFQTVYHGIGHQFINQAIFGTMIAGKTVGEASVDESVAAAVNSIEATIHTTELVPAPSGIGGPIDVVLLDDHPRPQQLKWKTQPRH